MLVIGYLYNEVLVNKEHEAREDEEVFDNKKQEQCQ